MEVVVVDVDDLNCFFVFQGVRYRPPVDGTFFEVHGALVMGMVQLSKTDQRDESRIIDIIGDLFLDDSNSITLLFEKQWVATATGPPAVNGPMIGTRA